MKGQVSHFNIKAKYFHFVLDNWMLIQVLTESNETPLDFDPISRGINFLEMCQILTKEK